MFMSKFVTLFNGMGQELNWYAVYTKSRHEKKLADRLQEKGIEAYVPLRKVLRQWSDRKKMVDEPLIRSYCFVKTGKQQYFEVLNTHGAVRYVWFSGKPATIPEKQINLLKVIAGSGIEVETLPGNIKPGTLVKVIAGPLAGFSGEMISVLNRKKVIVRIDNLDQVLSLSISPAMLERIGNQLGIRN